VSIRGTPAPRGAGGGTRTRPGPAPSPAPRSNGRCRGASGGEQPLSPPAKAPRGAGGGTATTPQQAAPAPSSQDRSAGPCSPGTHQVQHPRLAAAAVWPTAGLPALGITASAAAGRVMLPGPQCLFPSLCSRPTSGTTQPGSPRHPRGRGTVSWSGGVS